MNNRTHEQLSVKKEHKCRDKASKLARGLSKKFGVHVKKGDAINWALNEASKTTDPLPKQHPCTNLDDEQLLDEIQVLKDNHAATLQVAQEHDIDEAHRKAVGIQAELDQLKSEARDRGLSCE